MIVIAASRSHKSEEKNTFRRRCRERILNREYATVRSPSLPLFLVLPPFPVPLGHLFHPSLYSATIRQLVPRQVHDITRKCHSGTERSIVPRMFHAESVPQRCRELVVTGLDANSNRNVGSIDVTLSIYCLNFAHIRGMDLEREKEREGVHIIILGKLLKIVYFNDLNYKKKETFACKCIT